jgi:NAD(P)-dependent dehydrogenase (short-subunit alcohol dehydrogenase family)
MQAADQVPMILWINAGVGTLGGFLSAQEHDISWVYEVNAFGAIHTARAFVPLMLQVGGPRHVGITASSSAIVAADSVYAASKHAVLGIGEALRAELADHGVGVTLLIPGHAMTRIWDGARARPPRFGGPVSLPDKFGEGWRHGLKADDIAAEALDTVAAGGGYCTVLPAGQRDGQIQARSNAIGASLHLRPGN